jgi:hypothetical protein
MAASGDSGDTLPLTSPVAADDTTIIQQLTPTAEQRSS